MGREHASRWPIWSALSRSGKATRRRGRAECNALSHLPSSTSSSSAFLPAERRKIAVAEGGGGGYSRNRTRAKRRRKISDLITSIPRRQRSITNVPRRYTLSCGGLNCGRCAHTHLPSSLSLSQRRRCRRFSFFFFFFFFFSRRFRRLFIPEATRYPARSPRIFPSFSRYPGARARRPLCPLAKTRRDYHLRDRFSPMHGRCAFFRARMREHRGLLYVRGASERASFFCGILCERAALRLTKLVSSWNYDLWKKFFPLAFSGCRVFSNTERLECAVFTVIEALKH